MVVVYNVINQTWIVPKEQLKKLIDGHKDHINHFPSLTNKPKIMCNLRLSYSDSLGFEFDSYNIPNATFQFYFKNSNGAYQVIEKCSKYGSKFFKIENETDCEIKMTGMIRTERNEYPKISRTDFFADVSGLWEKKDKDFEIIVGKEKNVKVHKELLIYHSPVFEGMFRSGMEEAKTNTLKIIDFNLTTVKAAVEFFYGQDIFEALDLNDVFELFRFADKYDIAELRDCLESFCIVRVCPSNVVQLANYSLQMNLMKLKKHCMEFIIICSEYSISPDDYNILDEEFAADWQNKVSIV